MSRRILYIIILLLSVGIVDEVVAQTPTTPGQDNMTPTPNSSDNKASLFPGLLPRRPTDGEENKENKEETPPTPTPIPLENAIKNGDFEQAGPRDIGVAKYWERFSNGNAHFGWYDEQWAEAIYSGKHSQLMEIREVFNFQYRVIAIYQTVNVRPHSDYILTIHALMRSDLFLEQRDKGEFALDWGVDYSGRGDYNGVDFQGDWFNITDLPEQSYYGSTNAHQDDHYPLSFTRIKATIHTGDNRKISLFIRGVKKTPSMAEVNFNVDEVSLIGPYIKVSQAEVIPVAISESPKPVDNNLPNAGGILKNSTSWNVLAIMLVLVLVIAGCMNLKPQDSLK